MCYRKYGFSVFLNLLALYLKTFYRFIREKDRALEDLRSVIRGTIDGFRGRMSHVVVDPNPQIEDVLLTKKEVRITSVPGAKVSSPFSLNGQGKFHHPVVVLPYQAA